MVQEKCVVMFSGGLDSRLVVKIMQERGYDPIVLFFKLPFAKDNESEVRSFLEKQGVKFRIFDCTKGSLFKEYFEVIKSAKFGRGAGINPCLDCKIFMLKKAGEFARKNKIKFIVTGEVLGQRPMSQTKKKMQTIEKESNISGMILRPLIDIYKIEGRQRKKQIELAQKFNINFPDPAGGCILCERELIDRFKYLFNRGLEDREVRFVGIGRHFVIDGCWIVLGRDEKENEIIEEEKDSIISEFPAPSAIIFGKKRKETIKKVKNLVRAYSKKGSLVERREFDKFKL